MRRIISTEPQGHLSEMTIRTKDGRERLWNFVCSALGTQSDGRRLFVAMAYDVTDRKAYEDQILFLMREINHRAKNMLSLVQAVARQTAARQPESSTSWQPMRASTARCRWTPAASTYAGGLKAIPSR
jgi:two-component sensor histidine kinase